MKETEEKLVHYIKERYDPMALVLHGSRANGNAREHSDWDFVIFTEQDVQPLPREIKDGANFEIKQVILPIPEEKIFDKLGFFFRTENIKIIFDEKNIISALLEKNEAIIAKGREPSHAESRYAYLSSALDGMEDYKDNPIIAFTKKTDFYEIIVGVWYRFHLHEFKPSDYIALPRLKKENPELYDLISQFVSEQSPALASQIGRKILTIIFPQF